MTDTCLVVSPRALAEASGDARADDLFELVIEPALERFDFAVHRHVGEPTDDMLDMFRIATVCLIDGAAMDSRIAYECGRRDEAGRASVDLVSVEGAQQMGRPPIATVVYDLSTTRSAHAARKEIQRQVEEALQRRADPDGTSAPEAAATLKRIEHKLDELARAASGQPSAPGLMESGTSLGGLLRPPRDAFYGAVGEGRLEEAARHLLRMHQITGFSQDVLEAAALIASAGQREGADILESALLAHRGTLDAETFAAAVAAYVRFQVIIGHEDEGLETIGAIIAEAAESRDLSASDQAYLHNQLQILYWGVDRLEDAERHVRRAIELNAEQSSYRYNLSLILEKQGDLDGAERVVDEYMAVQRSQLDPQHLMQAIDIYLVRGREDDARRAFKQLVDVDPGQARVYRELRVDPEHQRVLVAERSTPADEDQAEGRARRRAG